jgi:hypothetical protein
VLAAAICAACSSRHPTAHDEGTDGQAAIRFDQVGYISGETEIAFGMGGNTLGDNGFTVRDARGQSVDVSALGHAELIAMHTHDSPALIADLRRQLDDGTATAKTDPFGAGADRTGFDSVPHAFGLATTAALYERVTGHDRYARFASEQRSWVLGANAWGSSFVIGGGAVSPRCPEHQVANLAGGGPLVGAVVNGPNAADLLTELNRFDTMKDCAFTGPEGAMFTEFDRHDTRYVDDVGAWQTVEPALDFTSTAAYSLALTATQ